jgi:hypothetical protein
MKRLIKFLLLEERDKLVRITSWWPNRSDRGICEWPHMLIDRPHLRMHASPAWDRARFRDIWRRVRGQ